MREEGRKEGIKQRGGNRNTHKKGKKRRGGEEGEGRE